MVGPPLLRWLLAVVAGAAGPLRRRAPAGQLISRRRWPGRSERRIRRRIEATFSTGRRPLLGPPGAAAAKQQQREGIPITINKGSFSSWDPSPPAILSCLTLTSSRDASRS